VARDLTEAVAAADGLDLAVLGCSGSYAGPGQACSGYLLTCRGSSLWVDAGAGSLANLQRHITLADLDGIVLTHEHPDHWTDVEGFAVASVYVLDLAPVPVFAPAGMRDRLQMPGRAFTWTDVADGDRVDVGSLRVSFSRTDHGPETLAVRVEGAGRVLGYSADTGPGWSLEALGSDLDLALCEATYLRDQEGHTKHMSARQAGESARQAGLARLVLTHRLPTVPARAAFEEGSEAFGAPVELAGHGEVYRV
jgi:ribonuclease BN (tRNA processing enzyme)